MYQLYQSSVTNTLYGLSKQGIVRRFNSKGFWQDTRVDELTILTSKLENGKSRYTKVDLF